MPGICLADVESFAGCCSRVNKLELRMPGRSRCSSEGSNWAAGVPASRVRPQRASLGRGLRGPCRPAWPARTSVSARKPHRGSSLLPLHFGQHTLVLGRGLGEPGQPIGRVCRSTAPVPLSRVHSAARCVVPGRRAAQHGHQAQAASRASGRAREVHVISTTSLALLLASSVLTLACARTYPRAPTDASAGIACRCAATPRRPRSG